MAPECPIDLKNPSLASLSQSLSHYHNQTDTRVQIRTHERAEHMSFGLVCVRCVYIHFWARSEIGRKHIFMLSVVKELIPF